MRRRADRRRQALTHWVEQHRTPGRLARWLPRAAYGLGMLVAPARFVTAMGGRPEESTLAVARLLGARHLVQAVATARRPTRSVLWAGALIDAAHGASMLGLAAVDPGRRRLAIRAAADAASWALTSGWAAHHAKASVR